MDGQSFKKEIEINPKNIYILTTIDAGMVDLYVERFKKAIGATDINYGSIRTGGKLFKSKILNVIYMQKIPIEIFDRSEYIFIYTESIDKRSAIYKQHKDCIIELTNNYVEYIMKHSNLNKAEATTFAKSCNNDFGIIKSSLETYILSDNKYNRFNIYTSDIYGWVDSFIKKQKLPKINESPISVMALLSTNCQNLISVKTNNTKGMNPYIINCMRPLVNYRTNDELYNIISDCFYLDCQIKKGLFNIDDVLKYLILKYM